MCVNFGNEKTKMSKKVRFEQNKNYKTQPFNQNAAISFNSTKFIREAGLKS